MKIAPYLFFNGQCEAAFNSYVKLLGGKIEAMMTHAGSPMEGHVPAEWVNKIMHASMTVGDQRLMASDSPPEHYRKPQGFSVSLHIQNVADAERIFNAFADGGEVQMPLEETFWAQRFGMVVDRFGTPWMINCDKAGC